MKQIEKGPCRHCKGQGKIQVKAGSQTTVRTCPTCQGTGKAGLITK